MKKSLFKKVGLPLKGVGLTVLMALAAQQGIAQTQFGSLFDLNPGGGTSIQNGNKVLYAGTYPGPPAVAADYPKVPGGAINVAVDGDGNIAASYLNFNNIVRKDKGSDKIIVCPTQAIADAGGVTTIAIDKDNEYIYYTYANTNINVLPSVLGIYKSIWKDNGANTSYGNYSGSAVGTSTSAVKTIPFLTNNDQVFLDGSSTRSAVAVGKSVKAIAFDADGNIFYIDASNHAVRKISIVKKLGTGTSGSSSIDLASVDGLQVGDLVSGLNIPASTYIGSIVGNTITLVAADETTAKTVTGAIDNTSSLTFITGVSSIVGTFGTSGVGNFSQQANQFSLSLSTDQYAMAGLAFDQEGNLLVGDRGNNRIVKIEAPVSGASAVSSFATGLDDVAGIVTDVNNNVYVAERAKQRILKFTSAGGTGGNSTNATIIAGSGNRLTPSNPVKYSTTAGSNVVTDISDETIAKIQVGMLLRGNNLLSGSFVTDVNNVGSNNNSITISTNATATETRTNNNGMLLTSANGFITTETDKGYFDGPFGIALVQGADNNYDLLVAEATGFNVRVLTGVGTLPVTLSAQLTAKLTTSGQVNLNWATASETDNDYFLLKRSNNGVSYTTISKQSCKGAEGAAYSFVDANPEAGVNYYQLSQVDKNGKATALGIKSVNVPTLAKKAGIIVYPNPVTGTDFTVTALNVTGATVLVQLTDLNGKIVFAQSYAKTNDGNYSIHLSNKLSSGIYVISVNNTDAQKIVVQ